MHMSSSVQFCHLCFQILTAAAVLPSCPCDRKCWMLNLSRMHHKQALRHARRHSGPVGPAFFVLSLPRRLRGASPADERRIDTAPGTGERDGSIKSACDHAVKGVPQRPTCCGQQVRQLSEELEHSQARPAWTCRGV